MDDGRIVKHVPAEAASAPPPTQDVNVKTETEKEAGGKAGAVVKKKSGEVKVEKEEKGKQVAARTTAEAVVVSERPKPLQKVISDKVTSAAVTAAVMLKQSPIPDSVASLTQATLVGYNRVDAAFGVQDRLVDLGQALVRGGVVASGIVANAMIRAGVAYHMTPGYRDMLQQVANGGGMAAVGVPAAAVATATASPVVAATTLGTGCAGCRGGGGAVEEAAVPAGDGRAVVRIVRVDRVPGGFPLPALVEASTQTDEEICGAVVQVSGSAGAEVAAAGGAKGKQVAERKTMLQSLVSTSASVATVLLTSSSNYVFGEETTRKLMGEEEEARKATERKKDPLEEAAENASPIRNLVVGGICYATTLETLRRVPGSRLAKWFPKDANAIQLKTGGQMAKDGTLHIDRDGTYFRHVLNHLRGVPLPLSLSNRADLVSLRYEAVYYDLVGLVVEIDERLAHIDAEEVEERRRKQLEQQQSAVGSFHAAASTHANGKPAGAALVPSSQSQLPARNVSPTPSCCSDTCSVASDDSSLTAKVPMACFAEYGGAAGGASTSPTRKRHSGFPRDLGELPPPPSVEQIIAEGIASSTAASHQPANAPIKFPAAPRRKPSSSSRASGPSSRPGSPDLMSDMTAVGGGGLVGAYPPSPAAGGAIKSITSTSTVVAPLPPSPPLHPLLEKTLASAAASAPAVGVPPTTFEQAWNAVVEVVGPWMGIETGPVAPGPAGRVLGRGYYGAGWRKDVERLAWVGVRAGVLVVVVAAFWVL
ncbi:BTB/POZ domain-containing protein kctd14 [Phlyctochytrium bullatum]|nr:BTB/POZ domain-containing protein kctd14 [Phlyctochytrium bullatum]